MPVWAAIVVGVGSGLAGSVIAALLTVSHQRAAEFRSRMLLAAEEFIRYGEAVRRCARHPHRSTTANPLDVLQAAWDDLVSAVAVVQLLFGHDSEAAHWAREAANELSDAEQELRAALDADSDSPEAIEKHMWAAGDAMERFGIVAARHVRKRRS